MQQALRSAVRYAGPRPNSEITQDFTQWKHQVRRAIAGLGHFEPPAGAGFHAALETLYADSHFFEFVAFEGWRQAKLDEATGMVLQSLQAHLDAYDEPDTDAAILADPCWWSVLGLAKQAEALLQ